MKEEKQKVSFDSVVEATAAEFEWHDISSEQWRKYTFPDGDEAWIHHPVALSLKILNDPPATRGGSHRVVDAAGESHYVPRGWILLTWKSKPFYEF